MSVIKKIMKDAQEKVRARKIARGERLREKFPLVRDLLRGITGEPRS